MRREKNGVAIAHCECVDSTNRILLENGKAPHLFTLVADRQTGGRGRMGRKYFSYEGGLYMSVAVSLEELNIPIHLCTPVASLAVFDSLTEVGCTDLKIKWVNDILRNGKKVCGILTECRTEENGMKNIVIGIGINLKEPINGFPKEIKDKAGYADYNNDKMILAESIVRKIGDYIKFDSIDVVNKYTENLAFLGQTVTVTDYSDGNKRFDAELLGVNEDCFMRIRLNDGSERLLSSGEILS